MSNRKTYPSDITREEFEKIRELLESNRRKTRPRMYDMYDIFCAILYMLDTRRGWRNMPEDFAPWRTVHEYFNMWRSDRTEGGCLLDIALNKVGKPELIEVAKPQNQKRLRYTGMRKKEIERQAA